MGEADSEAPTVAGRSEKQVAIGDGVRRFQHNILGRMAQDSGKTVEQTIADTVAWLDRNPNPNDPPVREYRRTRRCSARDVLLGAAVLRKQGGVDRGWIHGSGVDVGIYNKKANRWERRTVTLETEPREEARAEMPDVPSWVDA